MTETLEVNIILIIKYYLNIKIGFKTIRASNNKNERNK